MLTKKANRTIANFCNANIIGSEALSFLTMEIHQIVRSDLSNFYVIYIFHSLKKGLTCFLFTTKELSYSPNRSNTDL